MGAPESNTSLIYGIHIRESANDGSDFSNAAADYRILFVGEDGQIHLKDSAGSVSNPSTSASGMVLLETQTASNSATLDFTSFISSTYDEYLIEGVALKPATDGVNLLLRVGTGGGPTYDTGNNYYGSIRAGTGTVTAGVPAQGSSNGAITNNDAPGSSLMMAKTISNAAQYGMAAFTIRLTQPQSTSNSKFIYGQVNWHNGTEVFSSMLGGLYYDGATPAALTAVRFLMSSGNITSGVIRAYGLAK